MWGVTALILPFEMAGSPAKPFQTVVSSIVSAAPLLVLTVVCAFCSLICRFAPICKVLHVLIKLQQQLGQLQQQLCEPRNDSYHAKP
mmetsp:Transcript_50314/g.100359  ORF Transcript_50314/g.100359 Transcript_50314/m.100359 type:complete len:87 (+) Transcript_50314:545-805(+)